MARAVPRPAQQFRLREPPELRVATRQLPDHPVALLAADKPTAALVDLLW
ncbi:MAG: hypothetical protein VST64_07220 [Nitrospirota bacterium]|nr:hypothetical protein [Nitrospirota bacterium]